MQVKTCCFIGHREVPDRSEVYNRTKKIIENLIVNENVKVFHFGSRSAFDDICHEIVTDFQEKYPDIERINYNRRSEYVVKKEEKERLEEQWSKVLHEQVTLKDYEGEKMSERVARAGKASYVERNKEMINVALSRARKMLIVVGSRKFLTEAGVIDLPDLDGNHALDKVNFHVYKEIIDTINFRGRVLTARDIIGE